MRNFEDDYLSLVSKVLGYGTFRESRAGATISYFGTTLQIDCLEQGLFPILTQRQIRTAGVLGELAGFLRGATKVAEFKYFGCNYWDANAATWPPNKDVDKDELSVGKIYGYQWRRWGGTLDQVAMLLEGLRTNPVGRRHLLTTYNPAQLDEMCLPPCHLLAQYYVRADGHLDCVVYMRSVDLCLGLPSDIVLYATLLLILCRETNYTPGKLTFMLGDTHVYQNHAEQFAVHKARALHKLPTFALAACTIDDFIPSDLQLINYQHSGVLTYAFNV